MISIDDYHQDNIKLANLIKKHGLEKDTWFAIQLNHINSIDQIETLHKMGFNIASHTVTHSYLNELSDKDIYWELKESKKTIEKITKQNVDWIIYPRGRYDERVIRIAKELGYKYGRTTRFENRGKMELGGCHLTYPREQYNGKNPFEWAKKSKLTHYWGHMFEIEKYSLLEQFEEFLRWYKNEKY
jgi:peptidoglycan/xylan/chitin deacetylase (PgdA/CDA1 family)